MKAKDLQHIFHKELDTIYGKEEVLQFFFLTASHFYNINKVTIVLEPEYVFATSQVETFLKVLAELKEQKPIQYILGDTEFFGLTFKVNKDVLIPRPETEELVDLIIKDFKEKYQKHRLDKNEPFQPKILDIGTGSGCIAISLAKHLPQAKVYALDISEKALDVAKMNASQHSVDVCFINANILEEGTWSMDFKNSEFNVIVSNPPYVKYQEQQDMKPNVLDHEPHLALFVEDKNPLTFYKAITTFAANNLKKSGSLYFEINQYLGEETKSLLFEDFEHIELKKDLNGNDRILKGSRR